METVLQLKIKHLLLEQQSKRNLKEKKVQKLVFVIFNSLKLIKKLKKYIKNQNSKLLSGQEPT